MCFAIIFDAEFYNFFVHNSHYSIILEYEILILFVYDEMALMKTQQNVTLKKYLIVKPSFSIRDDTCLVRLKSFYEEGLRWMNEKD